jgi:hypothetical protein
MKPDEQPGRWLEMSEESAELTGRLGSMAVRCPERRAAMTDQEWKVFSGLLSWHISTCEDAGIPWDDYHIINDAIDMVKRERRGRPMCAGLGRRLRQLGHID